MKTGKERLNILLLMLYYFLLTASYILWLSPRFKNAGFVVSYDIPCMILSALMALFISVVASRQIERGSVSDIVILLLILLYFYPQLVLFAYCLQNWLFFLFVMLYLFILVLLNELIDFGDRHVYIRERGNLFVAAVVFLSVVMVGISGVLSGFRISFNLSDYYEYRFEVRELYMPAVVKYLFNWAKIVLPIGLTYALIRKKWWLVLVTSVSEILCFSFDGKKSSLFMFVLALGVAFFYNRKMLKRIPFYMILANLALLIEQAIRSGESFIGKNILRRMMFIPSYLGWAYYDFFQTNELDFFRSSVLRRVGFSSPYAEGIPRIIGKLYHVSTSSIGVVNANTGLCGDAYSNLGWFSLLVFPVAIVLVVKLIEKYLADLDHRLQIVIAVTVAYSFMSGAFFTVLLTNGMLILILLLIIMPRSETRLAQRIGNER